MSDARPDLFISADIETDGPIPGEFSMLSFALCLASRYDGSEFEVFEQSPEHTFYVELKPISNRFQQEALAVNRLDRDRLAVHGTAPEAAMQEAGNWVRARADGSRPVLVAYPVAFDWAFLYWYFFRYTGDSPFGFSSCLDIRTLYQARALIPFDMSSKRSMPPWLLPRREHTHNAADDAQEQAELFNKIFAWALRGGGRHEALAVDRHTPRWLEELVDPRSSDTGQQSELASTVSVLWHRQLTRD